jgi:hypothetical protein
MKASTTALAIALVLLTSSISPAGPWKGNGTSCTTDKSCCGTTGNNGVCVKAAGQKFGLCCTPTGAEVCDGLDNDCNGIVDDGCLCPDFLISCSGVCVDLSTDNNNCGRCGKSCSVIGRASCLDGHCVCDDGLLVCTDVCIDPMSDPRNCGACGHSCEAGFACCDGTCVNIGADPNNCGVCGSACDANQTCVSGACQAN